MVHSGGEVVLCGDCHRVYHSQCLKEPLKQGSITDDFLCHYCRAFQAIQGGYENRDDKRERRDLNHLLGLTCKKLRSKMPLNLLYRYGDTNATRFFLRNEKLASFRVNLVSPNTKF